MSIVLRALPALVTALLLVVAGAPASAAPGESDPQHCGQYDWDCDWIPNEEDNCPFHFNPGQDDWDLDGIGDACGDPPPQPPPPPPPPPPAPPPPPPPPPPPAPQPPPPPPPPTQPYTDGCNEYYPSHDRWFYCTPGDPSVFYAPDGEDPAWYGPDPGGGCNPYENCPVGASCMGTGPGSSAPRCGSSNGIPPPAPFNAARNYCSYPKWEWHPYIDLFNPACYNHDVCYGSQLGRQYCDTRFWKEMQSACKDEFPWWWDPINRGGCLVSAGSWYLGVKIGGGPHYRPRQSSDEP